MAGMITQRVENNLGPYFKLVAPQDMKVAVNIGVTKLSAIVQQDLTTEIGKVFDRPVALTIRAIKRRPRRDGRFFAYEVFVADDVGKGTAPEKYLAAEIYGGTRGMKRSEKALELTGAKAAGLYAVPGLGATRDAYGNMPAGEIRQVLSALSAAQLTAGYSGNMSAKRRAALKRGSKKRRGFEYFVSGGPGTTKSGKQQTLAAGVWKRTSFGPWGNAIKPVLLFVRAPAYQVRFRFQAIADQTIEREWPAALKQGVDIALSSSKSVTRR